MIFKTHRIYTYAFTLLLAGLVLPVSSVMGQALTDAERSRLDASFQSVVAEEYPETGLAAAGMAPEPLENEALAKSGETRYGAAIYTSNVQAVRQAGISVNSVESDFVTARVSASDLLTLAQLDDVQWVDAGMQLETTNDVASGATGAEALKGGFLNNTSYSGSGAMVCVIDTGIDWEHDDFRTGSNLSNSKIEYIWDQTLSPQSGEQDPSARGGDFSGFDFGVEYSKSDIENSFGSSSPAVRSEDTDGHGTHVAGTAVSTGNAHSGKKYEGMAPGADLIVVKAGNGSFSFANVIDGMNYCGEVADAEGKPVVVNMSLGSPVGPHDGTSAVAQAVDGFTGSGQIPVVSAGNDGSSGMHLRQNVPSGGSTSFDFNISSYTAQQGGDNDDAQFDIWFDTADSIEVTVTSPNGESHTVPSDSSSAVATPDGAIALTNQVNAANNDRRVQIRVFDQNENEPPATGTWTVTFVDNSGNGNGFHSWFYDRNLGISEAEPSIAVEGNEVSAQPQAFAADYSSGGNSRYTIGTPGTAKSALTVGAWTHRWRWRSFTGDSWLFPFEPTGAIASFSSLGPLRDGSLKPEITAPGRLMASARSADNPITTPSDSIFTLPGKEHVLLEGTSMSAPATAGGAALLFEENGSLTGARIKNLFANQAGTDGFTGATTPNNTWGHGKLDVFKAMAELTGNKVPEREQLAYDEDGPGDSRTEEILGGSNSEKLAVQITPDVSGSITGALLHLSFGNANGLSDSLNVEIWDDDGNGLPGAKKGRTVKVAPAALSEYTWNYIPLTETGVSVAEETDYHLVLYPENASDSLRVLAENASVDGRSSIMTGGSSTRLRHNDANNPDNVVTPKSGASQGSWSQLTSADLHARAFVSSTQPTDLVVDISSLDFSLLNPTLPTPVQFTSVVRVENNGEPVENLAAGDFTVQEEGTTIPIGGHRTCTLTEPGQGLNRRLADIVFVVDNSGSMGFEQDDVLQNIEDFVDEMAARGVNSNLGLTRYGQSATGDLGQVAGGPIFENQGNLVRDDEFFKNQILTRNITSGGNEPGYFAIEQSVFNFSYRSGAQKVFVVATDETLAQDEQLADTSDAQQAVVNGNITVYGATESGLYEDFRPLTDATNGQVFDIFDPFATTVADAITGQTSSSYLVTCESPSDFDGASTSKTKRQVDVTASASGVTDTGTATYDIGSRPRVTPSDQLKQVASTQQPADQDLGIETSIQTFGGGGGGNSLAKQSNVNAEVFYRTVGSSDPYSRVSMSETSGGSFEGAIPASDVESPGVEFYVQATDGDGNRVTLPSSNAATDPLKTAVEPNEPPTVYHELIDGTTPGQDLTLTAEATDDGQVEQVTLFYRTQGDLAYSQTTMTNTSDSTYEATVPGEEITEAGIEYYIEADDDLGVSNSVGLGDDPLVELDQGSIVAPAPSNRTLGLPNDVEVTFNSVFRALEYEVQWAPDENFPEAETDTIITADTSATLTGLNSGTSYHWRVRPVRNQPGSFSDTTEFETYPDQVEAAVSRTFNDQSQSSSYRLTALPGDRSTGLQSVLDGNNGEDWQAYRDDGDNLISFGDGDASNFTFEPGSGYWVLSKNQVSVSDTNPTLDIGSEEGDYQITIPLHDGWNIISNPLDRGVSWSTVESANGGNLQALWDFEGSYSEANIFASSVEGDAFYFFNDQGLSELVVPYPSTPAGASASSNEEGAALVLETFQDGRKTSTAKAGLRATAEEGIDQHDQFAPPSNFESASLRFVVEDKTKAKNTLRRERLAHEYRPAPEDGAVRKGQAYDVRLSATPDEPVTIKASGLEAFEEQQVVLLGESGEERYDLRSQEEIQFTPTTETTSMKLLVGDAQYVDSKKQDIIPDKVELRGNYPNPFSEQTTITYTLPEKQNHRVEVYDVMGRRIAVLEKGTKEAGVHRVQWSGRSQGGSVASGIYLLRLETEQATEVKKMTVVR